MPLHAQAPLTPDATASSSPLTVSVVVADAEKNFPSVQISEEELNASAAGIALARTAYLPRVDALAQFNRATRNNVFGALLPQPIIPSMSGPVIGTNNGGSVWGSATGVLVAWQPFDFGARHASVQAATAARDRASAARQRTQLEVATASADAFLTLLAATQTRAAAQAAVDNWETLRRSIHALTAAQLRPGADESRVEAEKAAALTQLAQADEAVEISRATLTKFRTPAPAPSADTPAPGRLLTELPLLPDEAAPFRSAQTPAAAEQRAAIAQSAAQLHAIERSWVPQFNLEAAAYARGTGALPDGTRLPGANGLAPTTGNFAAGVNITFPLMDFASLHAREAAQTANLHSAQAGADLTDRNLQEQFAQAKATLHASQIIAANTPVQLNSARTALAQADARYKAGLAPVDDLAQAQRLLVAAEIDDALARLNIWRAFLRLSYIRGDLTPFLQEASR
ncbi:MAG TPA: TolC family protein [Acidobacteriaceae bacterium]|nr:TolC family protein [Acidobacteriaceae bacterium]